MNRITPFVKRMRANGGTIYTFSSAVEDIGLNINERNNLVKISHFALLNIPGIAESSTGSTNTFNVRNIPGAWEYEQSSTSVKDGRVLIAESFENYALNLEANLLNQSTYNPELSSTVSERVFWKWLKETGAIRWDDPSTSQNGLYWTEEIESNDYGSVVKYVGQVSAGNVRIDTFGTYNETYVLVPTSHGQTRAYFKQVEDDNYRHGMVIRNGDEGSEFILGREQYTKPHPDGLSYYAYCDFVDSSLYVGTYNTYYDNSTGSYTPGWWYSAEGLVPSGDNCYLTDSSSYLDSGIYTMDMRYLGSTDIQFKRSKVDCINLELNIDNLKTIFGDSTLTYDTMANTYAINDAFNFNAVLIYYTIYNSTKDEIIATNLLGVMFLDAPSGNTSEIGSGLQGILLPSLEKIQSGDVGFGTSYSLRLNIKTDNMVDDTQATIIDNTTSDQLWAEEWQQAFANLAIAVNTLTQQNATINYISGQYVVLQANQTEILNRLINLEHTVNDIGRDIKGTAGTIPLFSDGDDPLIESSIYMKYGRIGFFNNDPKWAVHFDCSIKTLDIVVEKAIRDVSGNILIGYGSPLQLGSSTNYREVDVYTGNNVAAIHIDTSNNVSFRNDVSVLGRLVSDGSTKFRFLEATNIYSPSFDFTKFYIAPDNIGAGLNWDGAYLNVIPGTDVSAYGESGWIQFNYHGTMFSDPSLFWDASWGRLGLGTTTPSGRLHVKGDIYADLTNLKSDSLVYFNSSTKRLTYAASQDFTQWASGSYGSNNYVLTAYGDGSIVAESNLQFTGSQLQLGGDLYFNTGALRYITTTSSSSTTYQIALQGQTTSAGTGGSILVTGGQGTTSGGPVVVTGGQGTSGTGGGLTLRGGIGSTTNGNINIGTSNTLYIVLGSSAIPTGTPDSNEVLFIDTSDSNRLKRATITSGVGTVRWQNNTVGSNNYIVTAYGDGSIAAESTLLYNSNVLYAADGGASGQSLTVRAGDATTTPGNLLLRAGNASATATPAGNISLVGGSGNSGTSGHVYIYMGTSASYGNIYVANDGTSDTGRTLFSTGAVSAPAIAFRASPTTGFYRSASNQISIAIGGAEYFRFTSAGAFHAENDIVAYSSTVSDVRLKNNITLLGPSLEKILQLNGVTYDRKRDDSHHVGFVAQEVEKVIPEVINETELIGENGKYKTIRYEEMIPYLVESIKEQQKMIEELKEEIIKLKNK